MSPREDGLASTIAVVGASTQRSKYGNKCVRAYLRAGWSVFPVHPSAGEIEGLAVFPTVAEVPRALDRISVYLPPAVTLEILDGIAQRAERDEVVTFFNPGSADEAVVDRARQLGFDFKVACSIVDIGLSPSQFP